MKVSVVIPCLNEEHYIGRLLGNLARQSFTDFEVIVVDSHSDDATVAAAEAFRDQLKLNIAMAPRHSPAITRNAGAKVAAGEWLIFLDADVQLPDKHFLARIIKACEERSLISASPVYRVDSAHIGDRVGNWVTLQYQKLLGWTKHPVACGFCIVTRRDVFNKCGGFDATLKVGEDYDYVSRSAGPTRAFGFIKNTYFLVDLRRFHEGGKFRVFVQSVFYEIYRLTHGFKIQNDPFNYQFGRHGKPKK